MLRPDPIPPHAAARLAVTALLALLAGCTEPTAPLAPTAPTRPSAIIIIGGQPIVFTAQIRAIGNPDVKSTNAVVGVLLLKITETEDGGLLASWQTHFSNSQCSAATKFGGGAVYIQDSEDFPSPENVAALRLLPPGDPLGCGDSFLEGSSPIAESLLSAMIGNPDEFTAAYFLEDGGVLAGTLQLAGDELSLTR